MSGGLKLSVLDQSVAVEGRGQDHALRDTLDLAVDAEAMGYHRFWVSEHHGLPTIVGSAPEILMAAIAVRTTRIRVGSAGVMLPHYASLKVAEQFRVLDALAPGRIDLGVGRAPGSDGRTARALNPNAAGAADAFPQQVQELQAWTRGVPLGGIRAHPEPPPGSGYERAAGAKPGCARPRSKQPLQAVRPGGAGRPRPPFGDPEVVGPGPLTHSDCAVCGVFV